VQRTRLAGSPSSASEEETGLSSRRGVERTGTKKRKIAHAPLCALAFVVRAFVAGAEGLNVGIRPKPMWANGDYR